MAGLVSLRLINESIGISGYGDVAFILAFTGGICAIDLGFHQSMPRFIAQYTNTDLGLDKSHFWASCALFVVVLGMIQAGVLVAVLFAIRNFYQLRTFSFFELLAFGMIMIIGNLLSAGSAIFSGWQQYARAGIAKIVRASCYLGVIFLLWWIGEITVRSVLWTYALAVLLPNLADGFVLLTLHSIDIRPNWKRFPSAHLNQLRHMASYSMHGWLFTASTILVSSGSIFFAGLFLPSDNVANLQISLVLYTGAAAFVTGSMTPLTTIRARFSDSTADPNAYVAKTAHRLLEEGILLAAILLGFFAYHLDVVLVLLLGKQVQNPQLLSLTWQLASVVLMPGLMILPWFTFRFALVLHAENKRYNRQLFIVTCFALLAGLLVAIPTKSPLPIAISIAISLIYRGLLAYHLGHVVLPGLSRFSIISLLLVLFVLCTALNLATAIFLPAFQNNQFADNYLHALLYMVACSIMYIFRGRLRSLIGLRFQSSTIDLMS